MYAFVIIAIVWLSWEILVQVALNVKPVYMMICAIIKPEVNVINLVVALFIAR